MKAGQLENGRSNRQDSGEEKVIGITAITEYSKKRKKGDTKKRRGRIERHRWVLLMCAGG